MDNRKKVFDNTLMLPWVKSHCKQLPESSMSMFPPLGTEKAHFYIDYKQGPGSLFTGDEKGRKLAAHIYFMANIRYGFSETDVRCMRGCYLEK
ncbi:hypothetical protein DPMN_066276 [Dreissena polymorpha]|uniref:Uncharacterized protein n=1 Tax=Dreissena polymorpha TaxID=45954 RepID=A0A9D3YXJ0_DREPO|nr:hypothetical protein DPMN_066276 [Dreissena polymorpha]